MLHYVIATFSSNRDALRNFARVMFTQYCTTAFGDETVPLSTSVSRCHVKAVRVLWPNRGMCGRKTGSRGVRSRRTRRRNLAMALYVAGQPGIGPESNPDRGVCTAGSAGKTLPFVRIQPSCLSISYRSHWAVSRSEVRQE
jgi:hypothetical protein